MKDTQHEQDSRIKRSVRSLSQKTKKLKYYFAI